LVTQGDAGRSEWEGWRSNIPELYNPTAGMIVTANNDPYGYNQGENLSDYHDYFGYRFDVGGRARRIADELSRGKMSMQGVAKLQFDHMDLIALRFISLIPRKVDFELSTRASLLLKKLRDWDGNTSRDREEPVLFHAWLLSLFTVDFERVLVKPELIRELMEGPLFDSFVQSSMGLSTLYHRMSTVAVTSEGVALFKSSLEKTVAQLESSNLGGKRWGELHTVNFFNPLSDVLPNFPVYLPDSGRDGSWETVDVGGFGALPETGGVLPNLLPANFGPNFRMILEIREDGIQGWNVLPGGGKEFIPRPDDADSYVALQLEEDLWREVRLWQAGGHRPLVEF